MHVGWGGRLPIQVRIDDPPAGFDGGVVAEIVGGFENDPGRIQRFVRLRLIGIMPRRSRAAVPNENAFIVDILG